MTIPARLQAAFTAQTALNQQGIWFAPIRHHSPACAYAVHHLIQQIQPSHILIEAPHHFNKLIPDLLSPDTLPPVAIFTQAKSQTANNPESNTTPNNIHSAYFPFCDYSPEWVALRTGSAQHAQIQFIDLDWASQCQLQQTLRLNPVGQTNLMEERYLTHSQYIQNLANKLHCRNHDELWEHLFELQPPKQLAQASTFFQDVFTWCALARLDYENEVLLQESSLHREYCMYQHIQAVRKQPHTTPPCILIVTGGFHTLALIELLSSDNPPSHTLNAQEITYQEDAWLIRYSFDRLDALNGYASGMPSPAYYQQFWHDINQAHETLTPCYDYLSQLCHELHQQQALDLTPYIALKNTAEIATGLAQLRGHYRPSRYDILDALQTALIKGEMDDGQHYLWQTIYRYLSGQQLGKVAHNQRSPALLQNTYQQAQHYRFQLNDTLTKNRKLDIYRKPNHNLISRFLHLLHFLEINFAECLSGPDFINGNGLDLLFEEWRYAWTPNVEAQLLSLAEQGENLHSLALQKLLQTQQKILNQGITPSAAHTTQLLAQACRLGLVQHLATLQQQLNQHIENDTHLTSLITAAQQLFYLWHGRQLLQLPEKFLQNSILLAIQQAYYHLDQLYNPHEDKIDENLQLLKQLHQLIHNISDKFPHLNGTELLNNFYKHINSEKLSELRLLKLRGAMDTLSFLDQHHSQQQLQHHIQQAFSIGSLPEYAVQYLQGMFHIAPEIFVQSQIAIQTLHQLIQQWDENTFISILPDLRFIFSQLSPKQSQTIANQIASYTNLSPQIHLNTTHLNISEAEMLYGTQLNQRLKQLLTQEGLTKWFGISV